MVIFAPLLAIALYILMRKAGDAVGYVAEYVREDNEKARAGLYDDSMSGDWRMPYERHE
jgi:hypothetical protein